MIILVLNQSKFDDLFMAFCDYEGGRIVVGFWPATINGTGTVPGGGKSDLDLCTSPKSNKPN